MHLAETYALACGVKIDKPYIYEKYFPLPGGKYVTFQPFGQTPIKCYDYWQEVINLLLPIFSEAKISVIQIGLSKEKRVNGCLSVLGHTSINQVSYIINRGELHFGADSFGVHLASSLQKRIVALYSNNNIKNVGPFWSKKEDVILIEPDRKGKKPIYGNEERPKSINTIKPEEIAKSVCDLLGLEFTRPYETLYTGERYGEDNMLVYVPDLVHPVKDPSKPIEVRMDYHFNEEILAQQLSVSKCAIITRKAININILANFRANISHLFYEITMDDDPEFAQKARRAGVQVILVSRLSLEELKNKKINYLDIGRINIIDKTDVKFLKGLEGNDKIRYKSNKIILSKAGIFSSFSKFKKGEAFTGKFDSVEFEDCFFDDLSHYHIVKMID